MQDVNSSLTLNNLPIVEHQLIPDRSQISRSRAIRVYDGKQSELCCTDQTKIKLKFSSYSSSCSHCNSQQHPEDISMMTSFLNIPSRN